MGFVTYRAHVRAAFFQTRNTDHFTNIMLPHVALYVQGSEFDSRLIERV
jgi:hypothetical protein